MTLFSISVDIAAPPQRVWQVMADIERWPEWTASVSRVTLVDDKPLRVGSRLWIKQPKFPPGRWRVTSIAPERGFTSVTEGPIRVVANHAIAPTSAGSRVTLSVEYHGWLAEVLARLTEALTRRYLELEAAGLKSRAESPA